jgi:hypothetical protein
MQAGIPFRDPALTTAATGMARETSTLPPSAR